MSFNIPIDNSYARKLKSLHKSGSPVVFPNIFDPSSANTLISINDNNANLIKAAATASCPIAAKLNSADEDLLLPQNLSSVSQFSSTIRVAGLPLSMDLQDGYEDQVSEAVTGAISIGAVGCNIEDSYPEEGFEDGMACLRSVEEAADRIRKVLDIAREKGVPDLVVNARTDVMCLKPNSEGLTREMMVEEAVKRGKAYLLAGATSIFVWEIGFGILPAEEIKILVDAFQGRLAVKLGAREDDLSVKELADLGVCRISIGPSLFETGTDGFRRGAIRIQQGGKLWIQDI
ncbi:related to carboxyphosphonoenolpyruvate phosphonomutase-like protein [Rhynchosporium graminicola]|uniref:Related to carboxyphosphonoenolpyruvate phosphonomutase-like protein n=1 Tax=Rhynchosporium graminicola TaxID=2792576 RepID=A0A1E1L6R7_9HELO|nr:related to carboxyphosphonoenolpyruvate phosphonomutase-like protein [Rhynchosporium commune]